MNFRLKTFLVAVLFPLITLLFLSLSNLQGFVLYGTIFAAVVVEYFLLFWLLNFEIHPQGFVTIILLPVIWFAGFLVFYQNYLVANADTLVKIPVLGLFLILHYYFVTTQSILNISQFRSVSLSQAAFTTNNFYTILTFFVSVLSIFMFDGILLPAKFLLTTVIFGLIFYIYVSINKLNISLFYFGALFFACLMGFLIIPFLANSIGATKLVLVAVALTLVFKAFVTTVQYASRKVLSKFDYVLLVLEAGLVSGILFYSLA